MKIAYFNCFSGISGDMVLGALIDAGVSSSIFEKIIDDLNLPNCKIVYKKVKRKSIVATKVDIILSSEKKKSPIETLTLIDSLNLPSYLKEKSKEIFLTMAKAEAKIHQETLESLHLHELGSLDTLIDIVGAVIGLDAMGVKKVYASKVNLGGGIVRTAHGDLPVPAPATAELLKKVPVYSSQIEAELTTPTGAAILKGLSKGYGPIPDMKLEKIGYGAGEKNLSSPNVLRVLIGEVETFFQEDWVAVLETNIDDMNPQFYDYVIDSFFKKGALDVFLTPTQMKKNRPGVVLTVICEEEKEKELLKTIFLETTTLGVRISHTRRKKIKRKIRSFQSSLGKVKVKFGILKEKIINLTPEYDDCRRIAAEKNLPLREVYQLVKSEALASPCFFPKN